MCTLKLEVIDTLKCPYCGSKFSVGEIYNEEGGDLTEGFLTCECRSFPIIGGILNLKEGPFNDYLIKLLEDGKTDQAIGLSLTDQAIGLSLSKFGNVFFKTLDYLGICYTSLMGRILIKPLSVWAKAYYKKYSDKDISFYNLLGNRPYELYFKHRFSSETLWTIYPFLPLLKEGLGEDPEWVLDLSCGTGHASFILSQYVKPKQLICADYHFKNLYMARKYFVPGASFICLDAKDSLPFNDAFFSSIVMMDAFHYILSKASVAREMERVISPRGILLLLHLHNSLNYNSAAGHPLSPTGWKNLFGQLPIKILSEKNVIESFILDTRIDLSKNASESDLKSANAIILLGTKNDSYLQGDIGKFNRSLTEDSKLIINPLYNIKHEGDQIIFQRTFPDERFRKDYPLTEKYLPEGYIMAEKFAKLLKGRTLDLDGAHLSRDDLAIIEDLIEKFVIINVPENF